MYLVHQDVLSFGTFARSQVKVSRAGALGEMCLSAWDQTAMGAGRSDGIFKGF